MANHAIGSVWRRWDLHVHTPASVVQNYGGDTEDAWERFVCDLEALPPEFAVIGVNDYLFLDGYKKLRDFKAAGRLRNIETLLPVVEFRLAKFAGHSKLLRVNFHVILSEQLDPAVIESQFLVQLQGSLNVSAEAASVAGQWSAVVTRDSLEDLGRLIKADMPAERADEIDESDFVLGFNNLNLDDRELVRLLEKSALRGQYVTAIGKAEWDQYRWNDNSIAEKKNVINSVAAVFTAAPDLAAFLRGRECLVRENVNNKLLDCSDSHSYSSSADKDRIGNCLTWVKGDPTLDGLILAMKDYEDRVFVGPRPPVLEDIDRHPAKYIRSVRIAARPGYSPSGKWFDDVDLQLNPELIAVIGNRGMGKSALLDAIALAGNSRRPVQELSFLRPFQDARGNLAESFAVTLDWYTADPQSPLPLNSSYDVTLPSRVKHLPQRFIEIVCNDEGDGRFEQEIERVVFSHVPEDERLGRRSLAELIEYRSQALHQRVTAVQADLSGLNREIAALEADISPSNMSRLETMLADRENELRAMWSKRPLLARPVEALDPAVQESLKTLRQTVEHLTKEKSTAETRRNQIRSAVESARRVLALIDKVEGDLSRLSAEYTEDFARIGLTFETALSLTVNRDIVKDRETKLTTELVALKQSLDLEFSGSIANRLGAAEIALQNQEATLSAPSQVYQAARVAHTEFSQAISDLLGSVATQDTIRWLRTRLAALRMNGKASLSDLEGRRLARAQDLFAMRAEHADLLRELYAPVQRFVDTHPPAENAFRVAFEATLEAPSFESSFTALVALNKRGSFYGAEQAHGLIVRLLKEVDFNKWDSVREFVQAVHNALHKDLRPSERMASREVADQLRPGKDVAALYDFLFGFDYVKVRHLLTMGGRPLQHLSPGEKGSLLLVFYLLVDQNDCPLLIDQPEENLDNQSVFSVLVPFIREARRRRQVVLVTHNPNIAVVAGAEQIIFCEMHKADSFRLSYESGSLENPSMNQHVIDVLEGTRPAFSDRRDKYEVSARPR